MNEIAYVFQAWLPLIVWAQVDAPRYRKGFITVAILPAVMMGTAIVTRVLWARDLKNGVGVKDIEGGDVAEGAHAGSSTDIGDPDPGTDTVDERIQEVPAKYK